MKIIKITAAAILSVGIFGCLAQQAGLHTSQGTRREARIIASEKEIEGLFDRWNEALQTGNPRKVVALYAEKSVLLPTLSDKIRLTPEEKEEYFRHFLEKRPSAKIDFRQISIGEDMAVDSGIYTFTFARTGQTAKGRYSFTYQWDGSKWLIVSHHSSLMPEEK